MTEVRSYDSKIGSMRRIGTQPIALAAAVLFVVIAGIGSIALWRSYSGTTPELERVSSARMLQARVAQTSEQIMEKAKGLEVSQQESIDQLQAVQDQLKSIQQLVAGQRGEIKRLSDQLAQVTESLDTLRQSFASTQSSEASVAAAAERPSARKRSKARFGHTSRKRGKSRG